MCADINFLTTNQNQTETLIKRWMQQMTLQLDKKKIAAGHIYIRIVLLTYRCYYYNLF